METQVLSSGLDSAGISILSPLPEDSVTAVARRVLASTEAHHSMAERWIRVEPWNELLCRGEAIEEGQDKHQGENIGGDHTRENEELQDRRLAEIVLGHHDQVAQDVRRTRSETAVFREEKAREWLHRCVALFCKERGLQYVQGLSELAAPWALITDPPSLNGFSFRCFSRFLDHFAPFMFSTVPDMLYDGGPAKDARSRSPLVVLEAHLALFDQLLRYHDPGLASFMEACGLTPDAYATSWFVTIFARQTPIPILLELWERLVESGDPLFHQFLALAWLLRNRRVLMETRSDDVPEALSRLRLQSTEDVEGIWTGANALRRSTPRLLCETLRVICYEKDAKGKRSAMLRTLKATGMVIADADQVAELVVSAGSDAVEEATPAGNASSKNTGREWGGTSPEGGRFVLVDCRSGGAARGTRRSAGRSCGLRSNGLGKGIAECVGLRDGRVVWHTVDPTAFLGRESEAAVDLLHSVAMAGKGAEALASGVGGRRGNVEGATGNISKGSDSAYSIHANRLAPANGGGYMVGSPSNAHEPAPFGGADRRLDDHAKGGGFAGDKDDCAVSSAALFRAPTSAVRLPLTHICFVGSGGGKGEGDRRQLAADPAVRLARAAARSGLARVCVLEGGFMAFEEALARRTSPNTSGNRVAAPAATSSQGSGSMPCVTPAAVMTTPQAGMGAAVPVSSALSLMRVVSPSDQLRDSSLVPSAASLISNQAGVPGVNSGLPTTSGVQMPMLQSNDWTAGAKAPVLPLSSTTEPPRSGKNSLPPRSASAIVASKTPPHGRTEAPSSSPARLPPEASLPLDRSTSSSSARGQSISATVTRMSEKRLAKAASSSKISEPFLLYAAKSAHDMGRALRTLPTLAGRPLEDAARVCDSLAKTNVKVLGESRVSLTRSLARLEQLDARMSGNLGPLTRHFKGRNR